MSRDENDEGELLSLDPLTGPAGGSRATGSQVGQRRLSRRDEACEPLSAQPLASRAGLAPTRDNSASVTGSRQFTHRQCLSVLEYDGVRTEPDCRWSTPLLSKSNITRSDGLRGKSTSSAVFWLETS